MRVPAVAVAVVVVASAVAGLVVGSPAVAVVTPLGILWAWHAWSRSVTAAGTAARRRRRIEEVDALIQQLKAGASLRTALSPGLVGDDPGGPPDEASDALVSTTVAVLVARGGAALPSLERLSDTLRSVEATEAEARAQAGQATASATVLAVLPAVFAAVLAVADPRLRTFYVSQVLGALCLAASVVLSHLGWWLMHRLIGSAR